MKKNAQQQSQELESQEQQSFNKKTVKKKSANNKTETSGNYQQANLCSNCRTVLPDLSVFCSECGSATGKKCFNCGAQASSSADICQSCGVWILEGQCKFCYSEIPDEALFCPECGKPKDGIHCPACGKLSIFDFCSDCGKPVTEEAVLELKRIQKKLENRISQMPSGEFADIELDDEDSVFSTNQEARRYYNACAAAQTAGIDDEIQELELLISSIPEPVIIDDEPLDLPIPAPAPPKRKSLFSDIQLASVMKTSAAIDENARLRIEAEKIAEEKRKQQEKIIEAKRKTESDERKLKEENRKRLEEERQRKINEALARKEELVQKKLTIIRAWRCNAYGTLHPNGPNECADPSRGGRYV